MIGYVYHVCTQVNRPTFLLPVPTDVKRISGSDKSHHIYTLHTVQSQVIVMSELFMTWVQLQTRAPNLIYTYSIADCAKVGHTGLE